MNTDERRHQELMAVLGRIADELKREQDRKEAYFAARAAGAPSGGTPAPSTPKRVSGRRVLGLDAPGI